LSRELAETREELEEARSSLEEAQKLAADTQEDNSDSKREIDDLKQQLIDAQALLEQAQANAEAGDHAQTEEISALRQEAANANSQLDELRESLAKAQDAAAEETEELNRAREEAEQSQEALIEARAALTHAEEKATEEIEGLRAALQELKEESVVESSQEIDSLREEIDCLKESLHAKDEDLDQQHRLVEELKKDLLHLGALQEELLTAGDALKAAEHARDSAEEALETLRAERNISVGADKELQEELDAMVVEVNKLRAKNADLEVALVEARASADSNAAEEKVFAAALDEERQIGERQVQLVRDELDSSQQQLAEEKRVVNSLRQQLGEMATLLEEERAAKMQMQTSSALPDNVESLRAAYTAQLRTNASLLSRMQKMRGNILVCCRIRPALEHDRLGLEDTPSVAPLSSEEVSFQNEKTKTVRPFAFDRVFAPTTTQSQLNNEIAALGIAESVVGGSNACIMAYGQTGSGKTFTMDGPEDNPGVNGRTIKRVFELTQMLESSGQSSYKVRLAMMEIYNEEVRDLLASGVPDARKESSSRSGRTSAGSGSLSPSRNSGMNGMSDAFETSSVASAATSVTQSSKRAGSESARNPMRARLGLPEVHWVTCDSTRRVDEVLRVGRANRSTAATDLNLHSSRSHLIIILEVVGTSSEDVLVNVTGQLYLVDLAGSERVSKSNVEGTRLDETKHINRSLAALGDVMEALDSKDRNRHVPYRNSKLTHVLQPVLGGSSRTVMILTVPPTPSSAQETLFSLQFAARARNIELGPAKRQVQVKSTMAEIQTMRAQVTDLKQSKQKADAKIADLKRKLHITEQAMSAIKTEGTKKEDALRKRSDREQQHVVQEVSDLRTKLAASREALKDAKNEVEVEKRKIKAEHKALAQAKATAERKVSEMEIMLEKQRTELLRLRSTVAERENISPKGNRTRRPPTMPGTSASTSALHGAAATARGTPRTRAASSSSLSTTGSGSTTPVRSMARSMSRDAVGYTASPGTSATSVAPANGATSSRLTAPTASSNAKFRSMIPKPGQGAASRSAARGSSERS